MTRKVAAVTALVFCFQFFGERSKMGVGIEFFILVFEYENDRWYTDSTGLAVRFRSVVAV